MPTLSQKKLMESIELIDKEWSKMHTISAHTRNGGSTDITYKFVSFIGRGSFGVVVKILVDSEYFALKRVYQDRRYHNRELSMLLEVEHTNIINLTSYFYTDRSSSGMYLNTITEFAGVNLEEYIASSKGGSIDNIRSIYKQVLEGLKYLHGKNICHRDIKPSNILVDSEGMVKICDLGSAKVIRDGGQNITYICSRFYRAPENLLNYKGYDFKIDIWSAGCVMAEFRLQEPMFKGDTSVSTLNRIFEIVKVTEDDLLGLGCEREIKHGIGVRKYLSKYFEDPEILDVLEKSLTFSPGKRSSAEGLLEERFFRKM